MAIRKKSLWLDVNQGEGGDDKAFGFVGTNDTDAYQGWFFTWPGDRPVIHSVAEREAVLNSLEADEVCKHEPQIPYAWARQKLAKYLLEHFDLRTTKSWQSRE